MALLHEYLHNKTLDDIDVEFVKEKASRLSSFGKLLFLNEHYSIAEAVLNLKDETFDLDFDEELEEMFVYRYIFFNGCITEYPAEHLTFNHYFEDYGVTEINEKINKFIEENLSDENKIIWNKMKLLFENKYDENREELKFFGFKHAFLYYGDKFTLSEEPLVEDYMMGNKNDRIVNKKPEEIIEICCNKSYRAYIDKNKNLIYEHLNGLEKYAESDILRAECDGWLDLWDDEESVEMMDMEYITAQLTSNYPYVFSEGRTGTTCMGMKYRLLRKILFRLNEEQLEKWNPKIFKHFSLFIGENSDNLKSSMFKDKSILHISQKNKALYAKIMNEFRKKYPNLAILIDIFTTDESKKFYDELN